MAQDEVFLSDEAMELYNKEVVKKDKAQENVITWNPNDDELKKIKEEMDKHSSIIVEDKGPDKVYFNMPKIVTDKKQTKTKLTAEKIEKPRRKYNKKSTPIVKIVKLNSEAKIPTKAHTDDACYDLCSIEDYVIGFGGIIIVHTGIAIELPKGYKAEVYSRSGLASKEGISVCNAPGQIDAGYRGEICVILQRTKNGVVKEGPYTVKKGDKIAQFSISKVDLFSFEEVKELDKTDRGQNGFGSSGR